MTSPILIPADIAATVIAPRAYADGRIHEAYRWLRANEPLGVAEIEGVDPFWVVTRHADILEISRQNDLFHTGDRSPTLTSQEGDRKVREMMGGSPHLLRTLIHMDAPDHPKYRALTQALVHAAEPPPPGGPHPRDRPGRGGHDGRPRRRVRLRQARSPCTTRCT